MLSLCCIITKQIKLTILYKRKNKQTPKPPTGFQRNAKVKCHQQVLNRQRPQVLGITRLHPHPTGNYAQKKRGKQEKEQGLITQDIRKCGLQTKKRKKKVIAMVNKQLRK